MPDRQTVLTQLRSAGYGVRQQELNQRERRVKYVDAGASAIDQGYCVGFSLDWVRKVVLGGSITYEPKPNKTAEQKRDTEARQTLRAGTVHIRKTEFRGFDTDDWNADQGVNNQLVGLINWAVHEYNDTPTGHILQVGPNRMAQLRKYYQLESNEFEKPFFLSVINGLKEERLQKANALEARRLELERLADFPVNWQPFVQAMDDYVTERRREEGKVDADGQGLPASRPFAAIEVTTASAPANYANPRALANALIADAGFIAGRGSVFGMDIVADGQQTGHAVAAYRSGADSYLFMDPNYGIFAVNANGLRNCVQYLFGTQYNSGGWVVPGRGNYAIFQRAANL